ncbi:MAG: pyrimidine dimer DNA glycosylase/endonuclease V [Candidatus Dojkabacteria bacterium]|nr:pyrimidine dimer DNA glycosylase/endonuclease V [Candidatus Dojkabacteria bacterium]
MQTFLPFPSFKESAECLDDRRLNKQILEAKEIYEIVANGKTSHYSNHPIVKMWRNYPLALALYYNECLYQWKVVRKRNHIYKEIYIDRSVNVVIVLPDWLEDRRLCSSHRANLLRKDYSFYSKYGWDENLMEYWKQPYWWGEFGYGKVPGDKIKRKKKRANIAETKGTNNKPFVRRVFKITRP